MTLTIDPRNPPETALIPLEGYPNSDLRKALVLLAIDTPGAPVYFVIEDCERWYPTTHEELQNHCRHEFEQSTCPTNFLKVPLIAKDGDLDPHGAFRFVDAVWMTPEYVTAAETGDQSTAEYLCAVWPVLAERHRASEGKRL